MKLGEARAIMIVMADDDEDDRMLAREAWEEARLANRLDFVNDGQELMEYLRREGPYADRTHEPLPGLILLDLNMPRKDGREALREIKADPRLRRIPVVVLTTSKAEEDMLRSYDIGASAFVVKPVSFEALVEVMKAIKKYWFEIVDFPPEEAS
jgi:CheY-like chemotaxis protein